MRDIVTMTAPPISYKRHRFPPHIFAHAVWLHFRFPLSLSLTLADLGGVSECIFHALPDMARNLYTVSARPGHEKNLMRPYFTAYGCDVAECHDRFWIPCGGLGLSFRDIDRVPERHDREQAEQNRRSAQDRFV